MKSERLGLLMIVASLMVIAVTVVLLLHHEQDRRLGRLRAHGISLSSLLSRMPVDELVPTEMRRGLLDVVGTTQDNPDFAYAVVVGPDGRILGSVASEGVIPPSAPLSAEPSSWFGERSLESPDTGRRFREFHAPLVQTGELAAYVRVGYVEPNFGFPEHGLPPLMAWLALLIFLLVPVFYYLVRREIRPLRIVNSQIQATLKENPVQAVELRASGEMGEFVENFNRLMAVARQRVEALETERRHVLTRTKVLSYQKSRIESVLQSLPEGIVVLDEGASVTYANERVGVMLGFDAESVVGKSPSEWCRHPELLEFLAGTKALGSRHRAGSVIELNPDHNPQCRLSITAYPLFAPKDRAEILGTLVVVCDVTAEALAKEARRDLIAQLSHEMKTPLHVIGMYSEMLLEEASDSSEQRIEAGNVIHDEVQRLTALINNMLSISRMEMGNFKLQRKRTRLPDMLKDALDTIAREAKTKHLNLRLDIPRNLSIINVDKELLRVGINNLLTNAVKYNRPNGEVVLGAREDDAGVCIFVRDTGIGIAAEDQERIFEKFFRAEHEDVARSSGHGLGLTLAREIAQAHLGELEVMSELGNGSEFTLRLKKNPVLLKEAV